MAKRTARKKTPNLDMLKPITVFSLGTDNDPCFGKLYDLSADECQRCGDSEFCAIKMMQTLKKKRDKFEATNPTKDTEETWIAVNNFLKTELIVKKPYPLAIVVEKVQLKFMIPTYKAALDLFKNSYKYQTKLYSKQKKDGAIKITRIQ